MSDDKYSEENIVGQCNEYPVYKHQLTDAIPKDDLREFIDQMRESASLEGDIGNDHFQAIEEHWADELEVLIEDED